MFRKLSPFLLFGLVLMLGALVASCGKSAGPVAPTTDKSSIQSATDQSSIQSTDAVTGLSASALPLGAGPIINWSNKNSEDYVPDEVLLTFNNGPLGGILSKRSVKLGVLQTQWFSSHGLVDKKVIRQSWGTVYEVEITDGKSVMDKVDEIKPLSSMSELRNRIIYVT